MLLRGRGENSIVIWKSDNPKCFKGIDKSSLLVAYCSQSKAWKTADSFNAILTSWNQNLSVKSLSILFLADNASCYPRDTQGTYKNIKLVYLQPDITTSELQPLDLGIIQNTKVHYHKKNLRYHFPTWYMPIL